MQLRNREVRYRVDTETASPETVEDANEEDQTDESPSIREVSEGEQDHHGDVQEGITAPNDETPNWQDWSESSPSSSSSSEAWDPNNSAGSQPLNLGPPRTDHYPESEVQFTSEGWSYEVETYNEIYRISIIPSDFLGNTSTWPGDLERAHEAYKHTERPLDKARSDCLAAYHVQPVDHAGIYDLQRTRYHLAKSAAMERAKFMKKWPSAFNRDQNTNGHIYWAGLLVDEARAAQRDGLTHYQA